MVDVVLVGLPGSGKTTVGRALAHRLERSFCDTDEVFLQREDISVQDFLRTHDEEDFRQREFSALEQALRTCAVVATGGGIVTSPASRQLLAAQRTVWLDCPDELLVVRVRDGDRPLLGDEPRTKLLELRARRAPLYDEVSRCRVDASAPLDDIVTRLVSIVSDARATP